MTEADKDRKLLTENKSDNSPLNQADLKRGESVFASSWLRIHDEFDKMKNEDEGIELGEDKLDAKEYIGKKKKDKSKKGKDQKLEDKVSSADIKDWTEQKKHTTAFMEFLKTLFRERDGADIKYSFGEFLDRPQDIPKEIDLIRLEENDLSFVKMDENVKKNIETYGNHMVDNYLKRVNYN